MRKISAALLLAASLTILPVQAEGSRQLTWEDLAPRVEFEDPYAGLAPEQIADFSFVFWMIQRQRQDIPLGETEMITLETQFDEAMANLTAAGVDIDALVQKQDQIIEQQMQADQTLVTELNATDVSIPGYALPLEFSADNRVTEFLLVPYVGACIHVPPPPPNQIVVVHSEEGMQMTRLFEPVLVSGLLTTELSERHLTFVDGSADIPVGYAMAADEIENYDALSWGN